MRWVYSTTVLCRECAVNRASFSDFLLQRTRGKVVPFFFLFFFWWWWWWWFRSYPIQAFYVTFRGGWNRGNLPLVVRLCNVLCNVREEEERIIRNRLRVTKEFQRWFVPFVCRSRKHLLLLLLLLLGFSFRKNAKCGSREYPASVRGILSCIPDRSPPLRVNFHRSPTSRVRNVSAPAV